MAKEVTSITIDFRNEKVVIVSVDSETNNTECKSFENNKTQLKKPKFNEFGVHIKDSNGEYVYEYEDRGNDGYISLKEQYHLDNLKSIINQ